MCARFAWPTLLRGPSTSPLDTRMGAVPSRKLRLALILISVASWAFVAFALALVFAGIFLHARGITVDRSTRRSLPLAGLLICATLWAVAISEAWGLCCPHCRDHLIRGLSRGATLQVVPNLKNLYDQFLPFRLLRAGRIECPTCGTVANFAGDASV